MTARPDVHPPAPPAPVSMTSPVERPVRLRLGEFPKQSLAGEGNHLWLVRVDDRPIVLKVYEGSRSRFLYWKKTFGNVVITRRSSHMPRARCRTELACIRTWERHGFRCFGTLPEVTVDGLDRDVYMAYEYVPGQHFREYFRDRSVPRDERHATWRRFVGEWHRRHRIAVETDDPRLIHENGDVKHVMVWRGDFVYFDFEMVFTSGDVRMLVGREIVAYMRSVGRFFGERMYERMTDELVAHYPDKALLFSAWEQAYHNTDPLMRGARWLDRTIKRRAKDRFSKYTVALDIKRRLDRASLA